MIDRRASVAKNAQLASWVVAGALMGLVVACGTGGEPAEDVTGDRTGLAATAESKLESSNSRADGLFQACAGASRHLRNPFGLGRNMWETAQQNRDFLGSIWKRAVAMEEATSGPVRIVFHQPGGWFFATNDGMRGALPTYNVMTGRKRDGSRLYSWRWAVWSQELTEISTAHPDWILGIYFSGQVPTSAAQEVVDAPQAWEVYDHENYRHRTLMLRVVDQWMALGVREFYMDSTAHPYYFVDMPKLAAAVRDRGGRLYVEGHPRTTEGEQRFDFLEQVGGSFSTNRFMDKWLPKSSEWFVPADSNMVIALLSDDFGNSPTWSEVDDYRSRGFTILSSRSEYDQFVMQASAPN